MRAWMFHSWVEDFYDEHKSLENLGYLIGSFINPELVRKILGTDGDTYASRDEEFENTTKMLLDDMNKIGEREEKEKTKDNQWQMIHRILMI